MKERKIYISKKRRLLINWFLGGMICATILAAHYRYYNKYPSIELIGRNDVVANLKADTELLDKVKTELFKIEGEFILIEPRGIEGYWRYHSEPIREIFQKYKLRTIGLKRRGIVEINADINQYRKGVTYWGIRYSEDGRPMQYYSSEEYLLEKKGDGYEQIIPNLYSYYTEPVGGGWYYYETIFVR